MKTLKNHMGKVSVRINVSISKIMLTQTKVRDVRQLSNPLKTNLINVDLICIWRFLFLVVLSQKSSYDSKYRKYLITY